MNDLYPGMTCVLHGTEGNGEAGKQIRRRMKYIMWIILCFCGTMGYAQSVGMGPLHSADDLRAEWLLPGDTLKMGKDTLIYKGKPKLLSDRTEPLPYSPAPLWHEGLNVSISLSAFASLGKNAASHSGFGQSLELSYLKPLTKDRRLWGMIGGVLTHRNYGSTHLYDGSLYGMLDYRIDERWSVYAYGQYAVSNRKLGLYGAWYDGMWGYGMQPGLALRPWGGLTAPGESVVGIGVQYRPTKSVWIQVNVEHSWFPNGNAGYFDRYNYPIPQ